MTTTHNQHAERPQDARRPPPQPSHSLFSVPTPIKQLFDRFPILTYAANDLPQRAPRKRNAHMLYVFATERGVAEGAPSYNPACLKWQVSIHPSQSVNGKLMRSRPISSSPALTSRLYPRTTMRRQVGHCLFFFLWPTRTQDLHRLSRRRNCRDGA
jgi:hypothetical protein